MIFKNSAKNVFRTPLKTIIFFVLTELITVFLCTGAEMWNQSENFLKNLDNDYTTIASFEFVGENYPDTSSLTQATAEILDSVDLNTIKNDPDVLLWDDSTLSIGNIKGIEFKNSKSIYKKRAILTCELDPDNTYRNLYSGLIYETVYGNKNYSNLVCYFNLENISQAPLIKGKYIVHGEFYLGSNSYLHFKALDAVIENINSEELNLDISPLSLLDQNLSQFLNEHPAYENLGKLYSKINNSINVISTKDVSSLENFHQQSCVLKEGKFFSLKEAETNAPVVIITDFLSNAFNIGLGDEIDLSVYYKKTDIPLMQGFIKNSSDVNGKFKVVGISTTPVELNTTIYIPRINSPATSVFGYKLGQVVLKNGTALNFKEKTEKLLPAGMVISVYDQGYATAFTTLSALKQIGLIITIVSIVSGFLFLAVFAFLFINKQKDTLTIMDSLGSGKKRLLYHTLCGTGIIVAPASIFACSVFYLIFSTSFDKIFKLIQSFYAYDLSFSSAKLGIQIPFELTFNINPFLMLIVIASVILMAFILSSLMLLFLKTNPFDTPKRKKKPKNKIRILHSFGKIKGALKYALISITRGGMKSTVTAFIAFVIVIFLSILNTVATDYSNKLNDTVNGTELTVLATDSKGKGIGNLVIGADTLAQIYSTGYISVPNVSWDTNYLYGGTVELHDGAEGELIEHKVPENGFAYETFINKLASEPKLIYTNNIKKSPQFYLSREIKTEYLEGYSESNFQNGKNFCAVPYSFAESKNLALGDTIRIFQMNYEYRKLEYTDFKIISLFSNINRDFNIYCTFENFMPMDKLLDTDTNMLYRISLKSASFTLLNANNLDEFKSELKEMRISEVGRFDINRVVLLILDKEFLDSVSNLNETLRYLKAVYFAMFVFIIIIGFLVSYLLSASKKSELAIMRSIGTPNLKVFMSFFLEQCIMCLLGALIGFIGILFIANLTILQILSIIIFAVIYLTGTALSILFMMRISVMEILTQKE